MAGSRVPLSVAIDALLNERTASVEEVADRYFAPGYRQRTDGDWADRAAFVAAIAGVRESITGRVEVESLDDLDDGDRFAERHTLSFDTPVGRQVRETYVFGRRAADGRFAEAEDVTLVR